MDIEELRKHFCKKDRKQKGNYNKAVIGAMLGGAIQYLIENNKDDLMEIEGYGFSLKELMEKIDMKKVDVYEKGLEKEDVEKDVKQELNRLVKLRSFTRLKYFKFDIPEGKVLLLKKDGIDKWGLLIKDSFETYCIAHKGIIEK